MSATLEPNALFSLSYGLYVLTARDGGRDDGCIVNTVSLVTDQPKLISVYVNKETKTCESLRKTGLFNVSVLTRDTPFSTFERFGFQSGRDVDKFADSREPRSENGLRYLDANCNALISGRVTKTVDCGTHFAFFADLTESRRLSEEPSLTYAYYFEHIKPKPQPKQKRGFICKICGYFYEGDELPPDFICPICKHGADDFEPVGF